MATVIPLLFAAILVLLALKSVSLTTKLGEKGLETITLLGIYET